MLFSSLQFLFFLPIAFAAYWSVPQNRPLLRKWALLAASFVFYAAWNPVPFLFILYVGTADWAIAREMGRTRDKKRRKLLLLLSLANDLSVLGFFKYANFITETVVIVADFFGAHLVFRRMGILLPLGLSFLVFKTLTYTIDVYRKDMEPRRAWLDVVLYIAFFPQIVAGPIARARDFMPQLDKPRVLDDDRGARALLRIAKGMIKKLLIADFLAANIIDRVFASPELYSPIECWAAVFSYTLQIYYDFSALSDIAIGVASLFGFETRENFNRPYKSKSLSEFWRRWHLSLSTWLRDYLYIPLGGNRASKLDTVKNLVITMILGGIWHGATWRMALWGGVHAVGLSLNRIFWWSFGMPPEKPPFWRSAMGWITTFMAVMIARIFFRASSMDNAYAVLGGLVGHGLDAPNVTPQVIAVMALATAIHFGPTNLFDRAASLFVRLPIPVRAAGLVGVALVIKRIANFDVQPFIYTQF